jgi:hypothetical protein
MPKTAKTKPEALNVLAEIVDGKPGAERVRELIEVETSRHTESLALEVESAETDLEFSRPVGMVPLSEQLTETEALVRSEAFQESLAQATHGDLAWMVLPENPPAVESNGDRAVNAHPWNSWPEPQAVTESLGTLSVQLQEDGFHLRGLGGDMGALAPEGLLQMGYVAGFPSEFLPRLSPATAALVVNERLADSGRKEATVLSEGGRITCFITSRREMLPASEVAQLAWDTLSPLGGLTVEHESYRNGKMELRLLTTVEERITRQKDDVLALGASVRQVYGEPVEISLYSRRLVCLNGMIADRRERSWRVKEDCTREAQRAWVTEALGQLTGGFRMLADRARTMAETRVHGDPEHALLAAARAMRLPRRYHNVLLEAFNEEPGDTYWALTQAFTRLATHGALPDSTRFNTWQSAGDWVRRFELVQAELPLPTALSVGARILYENGQN